MEKKINVAEILKSCPRGMELDCTICNSAKFIGLNRNTNFPIVVRANNGYEFTLTKYGQVHNIEDAKCTIFPKGKTTWEGFVSSCKFEDGDILVSSLGNIFIFKELNEYNNAIVYCALDCYNGNGIVFDNDNWTSIDGCRLAIEEEKQKLFDAIKDNGYRWNTESKILENWIIRDAKDGDVICYDSGWTCIFKCIHGIWFSSYCFITSDGEFHTGYEEHAVDSKINGKAYLATKEQCNLLFQKIKEAGYKWNPETKTLEKLLSFKVGDRIKKKGDYISGIITQIDIENFYKVEYYDGGVSYINSEYQDEYELAPHKFDITSLKPFDKVLVRNDKKYQWQASLFSHIDKTLDSYCYKYVTTNNSYPYMIPYEGNEHLIGTTTDCENYYKTWE